MNAALKVLFLGNHTVGVRALRTLGRHTQVVGVVAHPEDPEDGVCYESVFAAAGTLGLPVIRATGKGSAIVDFIHARQPDLLWITDYRYLLPSEVIALAPLGAINLHPSLLPRYRGRAPINWAILHGETRLGLTAHVVDAGMDTGDVLAQRSFELRDDQDVGDALNLLYPLYEEITAEVIAGLAGGGIVGRRQDHTAATAFPRRTPADGLVDWTRPAREIRNLIRAVARPYPGAFSPVAGGCARLWRAGPILAFPPGRRPAPGELISSSATGDSLLVACGNAALVVSDCEWEGGARCPSPGVVLGATQPNLLSA